ncbi:alpha-2-macroglobulin [Lacihabitans sp. LS3-19]|uniref:alpha-2-macroglobulin family protein n=1 Tax=Lacihabitans sp. LS3-19 TaxID=2487335 RepID=UPI0020CF8C4B|nr:MG2 domain-containing protein [Lacihabitans sp. LS3-19]
MKKSVILLLALVFFNSCNHLPSVGIKSLGFGDEIEVLQNLFFEFDEDLMFDGDLNKWESTPYINFEPRIDGKFKWIGKKELVFSPSKPMKFANDYKATLSDNLLKRKKGKAEIDKKETILFHTPYLKVEDAQVFFAKNKQNQKEARVLFDLNGKYDAHNIKEEIKIFDGKKELDYKLIPAENSSNLVLALNDFPETKKGDLVAQIEGKEGNAAKFKKSAKFDLAFLPADRLEILKMQTSFKKLKGYIYVKTTQQIEINQLEKLIEIEPKVKFTVEKADQGFTIKGEFNQDDLYKVILSKNLTGVLGGKMDEDYEGEAFFGRVNPYLEFTNKNAQYISNQGNKNIGVNIINIPKVNITVSKIYENNILPFLKGSRRSYFDGDEEQYYFSSEADLYSDVISDRKIETEDLPLKQGVSILNLPLPEQTNKRGIYFVSVASEDDYYRRIQKIVSVSDIGIIVKMSQNQEDLVVMANSIMNTSPLKNLEIKLISNNNQEITRGTTNDQGLAIFKDLKKNNPTFTMAMVTASTADDFNYILFDDTEIETSKFDISGKNLNEAGMDAFIYGDREIYRPGETININTVIRKDNWDTPANIPIKILVKQPNGKEISSAMTQTNASGAIQHSVKLERSALTGFYNVDVFTGNNVLIGSKTISVEDFMPDRIKVVLDAPEKVEIGQKAQIKIQANNLFGPPAADNKYELDFSIKRKTFSPKGFEGFTFGIEDQTKFENELRNGITNAKGEGLQIFDIDSKLENKGLLEGKVLVSVFDETGRPVHRKKSFEIFTQKQFFGLKIPTYFVGINNPLPIEMAAVNSEGKSVSANAKMEIYLLEYQTVLEKTEEGLRYVSKRKEKLIKSQNVNFAGKNYQQNFVPRISGEYEIRIMPEIGNSFVSTNFYAYGYGSKVSFEVDSDGEVMIETNQESYVLGEKVKAIFKTPFDGKLLVTVENAGILEHKFIQTTNKSAEITIDLKDSHLPNVFITATLIRAMDQPELPLMSAHGMKTIKVDDPKRKIPIVITAVEKSRSKTKQKVEVRTLPNTELTIAVVDEGILQLKNTETPKINEYFYQKRALGVRSFDLYPLLLPEIKLNAKSSTGGDGGMGKRVNPLANGRAELVAKWSGQLKSDENGKANFEFDIPEFLGSLRIMVVAYKGEKFGSEEQKMTVTDPISISVGMPLFLSPTDKVKVPVTFFNTTEETQEIKVSAQTEGEINAGAFSENKLTIEAGKEKHLDIEVAGKDKMGLGKLKILAKSDKETFSKTTEISVRPAGSLQKSGSSGILAKDKELAFASPDGYIPGTFSSKIYIGNTPMMQFGNRLETLLAYPHGCLEQTISKAFPQLYLDDLIGEINGKVEISESGNSERNPQYNVNAAIQKIEGMQLYNGALSYWPGSQEEYWWGTAYALHFLLEAQKSGFEVTPSVISQMTSFLTQRTNEEEQKETIWTATNGVYRKKERLKTEIAYSLYVLSLTDEPNISAMNLHKAAFANLSSDQQFLIACAYKQIGDDATYGKLLPKTLVRESYDRMLHDSFSSPIRNMALVLNTLVESDPSNPQIASLTQALNTLLSNKTLYLNTQELSFSMLAMGKILKSRKSTGKAEIFSEGKLIRTVEGKGQWIDMSKYPKGISVKSTNDNLYYYYESEGIRKDNKFIAEDKFLKARRAYFTRTGEVIKSPIFKQNQLVVVRLTVSAQAGLMYNVDNVVLTDMLPAGFEIENPRLVEDRDMPWIKNASNATYFDIRDDRINYFVNVDNTERHYYYLARAVTRGTFVQGPVSADAMYNNNLRSYWGGGTVVVN